MNPIDLQTFNQAVSLAQAGQKQDAYGQIKTLYYNYPDNTDVLIWLAYTTPDSAEADWALNRATNIEPGNARVASARDWLAQEKAKQWNSPPPPPTMPVMPMPQPQYYQPLPPPQPYYQPQPQPNLMYNVQAGSLGFQCPYCRTNVPPMIQQRISTGGWIVFAVLLVTCFPLCWIGLLMKENYQQCIQCGVKLN